VLIVIVIVLRLKIDPFSLRTTDFSKLRNTLMSLFSHLIKPRTLCSFHIWIFSPLDR
jgi:hypothetical protein